MDGIPPIDNVVSAYPCDTMTRELGIFSTMMSMAAAMFLPDYRASIPEIRFLMPIRHVFTKSNPRVFPAIPNGREYELSEKDVAE